MAKGFGSDDDVLKQIESTVDDEVLRARRALPQGESLTHCEECEAEIPAARRKALPGVRLCVACQEIHDQDTQRSSGFNRRGSKDSQLR